MSKWRDRINNAKSTPTRGGEAGTDYDEYPNLSEALAGVPTKDGSGWEAYPHSLTLWLEGGRLKFALGNQWNNIKTFGTAESLSVGLAGIEKSLETDQCETKAVKGTR